MVTDSDSAFYAKQVGKSIDYVAPGEKERHVASIERFVPHAFTPCWVIRYTQRRGPSVYVEVLCSQQVNNVRPY